MSAEGMVVEVVEALAAVDGRDPTDVEYVLADHIDPGVLERLAATERGV